MSGNVGRHTRIRICALAFIAVCGTPASPGADIEIIRAFDRLVTLTNRPIVVTVTLSNATGQTLRGLWFSEQVPAGPLLTSLNVSINDRPVTNHLREIGQTGDVYPDCTPHRWILERPRAFAESNPVPPGATVQIRYALTAGSPGAFWFPQAGVAGVLLPGTNAAFELAPEAPPAHFLTLTNRFAAFGEWTAGGFRVRSDAPTGWCYAVEVSTNLVGWERLASSVAPAAVLDTGATIVPQRFYRLVWLP